MSKITVAVKIVGHYKIKKQDSVIALLMNKEKLSYQLHDMGDLFLNYSSHSNVITLVLYKP